MIKQQKIAQCRWPKCKRQFAMEEKPETKPPFHSLDGFVCPGIAEYVDFIIDSDISKA